MTMKITTINLPDQYVNCIETMVNQGFFPSRSEVVREAIKKFLTKEIELNKGIEITTFEHLKKQQMETMLH